MTSARSNELDSQTATMWTAKFCWAHLVIALFCPLIFLGAASPSANADLCQHPRIIKEIARSADAVKGHESCRVQTAPYKEGAAIQTIEIAYVLREAQWDFDLWNLRWDAFAQLPNGTIMELRNYRVLPMPSGNAVDYIFRSLGMDDGVCCIDRKLVFEDSYLVRRGNFLCSITPMKPPFRGSVQDCDGRKDQGGNPAYPWFGTTWGEAFEIGCRELMKATGKHCGTPYNRALEAKLFADPDGTLYYLVTVRSLVRVMTEFKTANETPVQYEIHQYRVNLMEGDVRLQNHRLWNSNEPY